MHVEIHEVLDLITRTIAIATGTRIVLHWSRQGLMIWFSPEHTGFWSFYSKLELTASYVAGSLAAWGKKNNDVRANH